MEGAAQPRRAQAILRDSQICSRPVVPIADSFRPSRDPARALPLSHLSSDSDGGILQIDPSSHV